MRHDEIPGLVRSDISFVLGQIQSMLSIIRSDHPSTFEHAQKILDDERFLLLPASIGKHHYYRGGLLQHTFEVMHNAIHIARAPRHLSVSALREDVVIAGAFFHDVGKLCEYQLNVVGHVHDSDCIPANEPFRHVYEQKLFGHLSRSYAEFLQIKAHNDQPFLDQVAHTILAHHGRPEWGSPVTPKTREAWAVHLADMQSVFCSEYRQHNTPD